MKRLTHIVRLVCFAAVLSGLGARGFAEPQIDISFEADTADSQKLVRAQTVFPTKQSIAYKVFDSITTYPILHDWIRQTTLLGATQDSEEFLVEFTFPWPVGRQWSRVEVRHGGNRIFWKQVAGSLKANHGHISFTPAGNTVHIDYRAAIDIGLPDLWTRSYKAKFIREFLTAACEQAETVQSSATLALAADH